MQDVMLQEQQEKRKLERSTSENGEDVPKSSLIPYQTSITPPGSVNNLLYFLIKVIYNKSY